MHIQIIGSKEELWIAAELSSITGAIPLTDGMPVEVTKAENGLHMEKNAAGVKLSYTTIAQYCRGLGLLAEMKEGEVIEQTPAFETLGYMPDQSRNAVFSMEGAKRMVRTLASMGYNAMMLYTEDTYEIDGYPYFGYMRGKWTKAQLKELDAYALQFGIELIPCIEVLAHLEGYLKQWEHLVWPVWDIDNILIVGEEETYRLIDAMLKTCAECFTSRRINLGMDEAQNIGRGRYLEKFGYKKAGEIMHEHLNHLLPICQKYGFTPMMWSDMFFRPQHGGEYYIKEGRLGEDSIRSKPDGVMPIYWDYYSDGDVVDNMMCCHEQFGCKYAFAGGAWKWSGIAPANGFSLRLAKQHLEMCVKHGVSLVFATGWGDQGGEASPFSTMPVLMQYAQFCYTGAAEREELDQRLQHLTGLSLDAWLTLDTPGIGSEKELGKDPVTNQYKYLLYNDPLIGLMNLHISSDDGFVFGKNGKALAKFADNSVYGYIFDTLSKLCSVLELKATLPLDIRMAYELKENSILKDIVALRIPEILRRMELFESAFREQWRKENRSLGFEVQEQFLGGAKERLRTTCDRIQRYLDGLDEHIEELEEENLPFVMPDGRKDPHIDFNNWYKVVTANKIL